MSVIKTISKFRKHKMNYINRYFAFIILYFIMNFASGSYESASLGFFANFGGVIFAPFLFVSSYFCAGVFYLVLRWNTTYNIFSDLKNWSKTCHNFNISSALLLFDIWLAIFTIGLFLAGIASIN